MVVLCVLATCAIATWEVHAVLRFFWFCVLKLTLFALTVELQELKTPEENMELRMALSGAGKYAWEVGRRGRWSEWDGWKEESGMFLSLL
jgi:hypothetical protein